MSGRRNFSMDDEAEDLLDEHEGDNHSQIVRDLIKEYYTTGVYDVEEAAIRVRKRELERQEAKLKDELTDVQTEQEQLDELTDETAESDIETVAEELEIADPEKATPKNPVIRRKAKENGLEPNVLAEVVKKRVVEMQHEKLSSA